MRRTIASWFVILCALASPAGATPQPDDQVQSETVKSNRQPMRSEELARYEQRERSAKKQKQFEGGRVRNRDLVTVILILVIVLLVLIII